METATARTASLWHHSNFMKLWLSESISSFGGQFSGVAIPLTAVYFLHVTSLDQGILQAASTAPFLLFGLIVGVWVDRHQRRPVMVLSNTGRALLLGSIPLAFLIGRLSLPLLVLVAFLVGVFQVFFDVAYQAYLPSLVDRTRLTSANSMLEGSRATSQVAGPGLAGILVQLISAPLAVAVDAFSFLGSSLSLARIRHEETAVTEAKANTVLSDIREGLSVVFGDLRLRSIAGSTATSNFFSNALFPVAVLYIADPVLASQQLGLGLSAFLYGLIFTVGAIGGMLGAFTARPVARRIGVGPTIVISMMLSGLGSFGFYLASPDYSLVLNLALLMAGAFAAFMTSVVYNVNQVSLRQATVPLRLQGRMNATMRFLVWGTLPLGAIFGGFLGTIIGVRPAILVAAIGGSLAFLWVLLSPVRNLREIPEPME